MSFNKKSRSTRFEFQPNKFLDCHLDSVLVDLVQAIINARWRYGTYPKYACQEMNLVFAVVKPKKKKKLPGEEKMEQSTKSLIP